MAKFLSKCSNQILCMVPNRVQVVDGIMMPVPGKRIEFVNGEYETTDKQEMAFIKKHRLYGSAITEAEEIKAAGE